MKMEENEVEERRVRENGVEDKWMYGNEYEKEKNVRKIKWKRKENERRLAEKRKE